MLALNKQESKIEYPRNWVPLLRSLVLEMQSAEIRTVEALCVALAQDDTDAGRVMAMLLEFLPRSIRVDGAIWKSDRYWWTDHRINYRKMVRARRNFNPIVSSWKQKAQGAPTWHYQIDGDEMVLGMARTLDCSTMYVKALILQNQNDENGAKTAKNAKSITLDSDSDSDSRFNQQSKTVTEIEFALIGEGVHAKTAVEFAAMNPLTVRRVIDDTRAMDAAGKIRKNKAAVLVSALRRELTLTPQPPLPQSEGEQEKEQEAPQGDEQDEPLYRNLRMPEAPKVPRKNLAEKYVWAWNAALNQLEVQLDRVNFETWVRGGWLMDVEESVFVIGCRNNFVRDMLAHRLYRSVRRILSDAYGQPVELRFEIAQAVD